MIFFQFKDPLNLQAPPGAHALARETERSGGGATANVAAAKGADGCPVAGLAVPPAQKPDAR